MRFRTAGATCQGRRVPGGGQGTGATACQAVRRGLYRCARHGHGSGSCGAGRAVTGRMTEASPKGKLHSARLPKPGQAASVRGPVQPSAIRSAQGRACVHRVLLSS